MKKVEVRKNVFYTLKKNNDIYKREWLDNNGELHRENGPAYILYSFSGVDECYYKYVKTKRWYNHGIITKLIHYDTNEVPAVEYKYKEGILTEYINYHTNGNVKTKTYFNEKKKWHNENGPAHIEYNENGEILKQLYYLNGKQVDELKFLVLSS